MKRHQRIVAALLVTASLTAPGLAFAKEATSPTPPGTPISAPPAPAATKVSQADAIRIARQLFAIPAELGEPNVGFSETKAYTVWRLDWHSTEKQSPKTSIGVEIDANTGVVRSYSRWRDTISTAPLTYTRTEAKKLADDWLTKLGAQLLPTLRHRELNQAFYYGGASASYGFHWDRLEQGYPISGQGVDIAIDARTGDLERYSTSLNDGGTLYTLPKEINTQAQAEAVYRSQLPMVLQYQRFVKPGTDDARWQLIYRPVTGSSPLVSTDGKLLDFRGAEVDLTAYKDQPVVPVPIVPYKRPEQPLTREEALKLAMDVTGRTEEPASSNYSESGDKVRQRVWDFAWSGPAAEPDGGERHTSVRIDAESATVLSLYNWRRDAYQPLKEGEEPKLTLAEARQNALGLMLRFRPDLAGAAQLQPDSDDVIMEAKLGGRNSIYNIRFTHLHMGIPMSEGASSLQIDARTGELMAFSSYDRNDPTDQFPATDGVIEPAQAINALLAQQPLELTWTTLNNPGMKEPDPQGPKVVLLWAPSQSNVIGIDAKLGVPLDGAGRDLIEAARRPTDIEGHFAQREIDLLWTRGVFELKDGKFNPGGSISVEELARWLVLSKGMQPYLMYDFRSALGGSAAAKVEQSANAGYFGAAFQSGIFVPEDFAEGLDLNAQASREQFALWAARAMGYGAIAKMENRIELSFTDKGAIDPRYANAVGILQGLGIVRGAGAGAFEPKRLLTRAEAAKMLFAITAEPRR